jgi:hypothetical protein
MEPEFIITCVNRFEHKSKPSARFEPAEMVTQTACQTEGQIVVPFL